MTRKRALADYALWAALPMAHPSKVEERITMVLDKTRRRTSPRRFLLVAIVGAAVLAPIAMLQPAGTHATPTVRQTAAVPAESEAMQRERQYALENGRFMGGQGQSPNAVLVQEQQLAAEPNDYAAHLRLLGYYLNSGFFGKPLPLVAARLAYRGQVFWLIQNHPESLLFSREYLDVPRHYVPAMFEGDKSLWQDQIARHPSSAIILGNAEGYYLLSDKALGEKYLLQAQTLEPSNPEWPSRLGELYQLNGPFPPAAVVAQSSKKALAEYEKSVALASKSSQFSTYANMAEAALAETAFDAGEYDKAKQYAEEKLKRGQNKQGYNPSADVYTANQVLGRLALRGGDIIGRRRIFSR